MLVRRTWVGSAWVLSTLLYCGCSGGGSAPTVSSPAPAISTPPATNGNVATAPTTNGNVATVPPTANGNAATVPPAQNSVPPATNPAQTPPPVVPPAAPAKDDAKQLLAQIKEIQAKPVQPRSRADLPALIKQLDQVIELSEKALNAKPEPTDRDEVRSAALQAIVVISQFDQKRRELLDKMDKITEATLADSAEGPLAASAYFSRAFTHLNIERDGSENDPAINKRLFALAKEFSTKFPTDPRSGQLLYMIGENASMDGQNDTALEIFKHIIEIDPSGQAGEMAKGKLALLEAVGKPPEIAGPTLEGSEINITQFKGKVVLVDFWATWCGPCVAELPNVQAVYEKYHDQGFEVLAVSFDQTKEDLTRFVEARKLPWPQIFFDEEGKRFWQNPLGQKYGINAIPATFLVDRDGILQKIGVRGEALETSVVELLKSPVVN